MQQNVSYSVRQLIRDAIRKDGYVDVTCREVEQLPKRGRPPKEDYDEPFDEQVQVVHDEPQAQPQVANTPKTTPKPEPVQPKPPAYSPPKQNVQQNVPVSNNNVSRDEDGFVDPESLLNF